VPFLQQYKDSVKAISDVIYRDLLFPNIFVWLVNDIKSFNFGHIQYKSARFDQCPLYIFEMLPRPLFLKSSLLITIL
jgi:hypothetical protein